MGNMNNMGLNVLKGEEKLPLHYRSNTIQRLVYEGFALLDGYLVDGAFLIPDNLDEDLVEYISLLPLVLVEAVNGSYSQDVIENIITELDTVYYKVRGVRFGAASNMLLDTPSYNAIKMALQDSLKDVDLDTYVYKNTLEDMNNDFVNSIVLRDAIADFLDSKQDCHAKSCAECNVCENCELKESISNCLECELCYNCRNNDLDYDDEIVEFETFDVEDEGFVDESDYYEFVNALYNKASDSTENNCECNKDCNGNCCNHEYMEEQDLKDDECNCTYSGCYSMKVTVDKSKDEFEAEIILPVDSKDCILMFDDCKNSLEAMVNVLIASKIAIDVMSILCDDYHKLCSEWKFPNLTFICGATKVDVCRETVEMAVDVLCLLG